MEEKLIDLTAPEFQGCFGHDIVEELNAPGFYRIPLKNYDKEEIFGDEEQKRLEAIAEKLGEYNHNKPLNWYELPNETRCRVVKDMIAEGWDDYDKVNVHIDKVLFLRNGGFQLIHTTDPGIFTESGWAYYNGAECHWKDSICLEEIMEELIDRYGLAKAKQLLDIYWDDSIAEEFIDEECE